jgi:predicted metal-binding protein
MSNLNLFENTVAAIEVDPQIDYQVRGLCVKPYPLHPKGCPNVGKCDRCPPKAPLFHEAFDLTQPVYAVVNEFDLAAHVERMKAANPQWTDRQLYCVLYWQGTARKQLKAKIEAALSSFHGYEATWCPEGMGVNVTETLAAIGIELEWPPKRIVRQVALLGIRRDL